MYIDLVTINLCPGQGGGGVKPSGTLEISENGVYDVYSYSSASVDVHPSASLSETYISNGNYNITGEFNGGVIKVDVPAPQFVTETLNVSANGTYNPGEGIDGYSQVVVDVPQSVTGYTQKELTEGLCITNLNNSASFVGSYVFAYNRCLTTVDLPVCSYISNNAFQGTVLTTINLPMCKSVSGNAFYNCVFLTSVNLPKCSYIGNGVFKDCHKLTSIDLPVCSYIGNGVFQYCGKLTTVNLPVCSYIGGYTFFQCTTLTSIDLPVCSYISNNAFNYCSSLSQVSLPVCSIISNNVFGYCKSLSIITLGYSSVCSLGSYNTFSNTQITSSTGSIYVPASLVDSYKSAKNWSYFSNRIFPIE